MRFPASLPLRVLVVAVIALGAGSVRTAMDSARELSAGRDARARGETLEAVRHLRRAAHAYLPGSPWCAAAYAELAAIGTGAEAASKPEHAFAAWRAIRSSALGTRWVLTPHEDALSNANLHLASLLAAMPAPGVDRDKSVEQRRTEHLALLQQNDAPAVPWLLVMGLGFALWTSSVWRLLRARAPAPSERTADGRQRWIAAAGVVVGLALFLAGVARA